MKTPVARKDLLNALIDPGRLVSRVEIQEITMAPGVKAPLHLHPCPTVGVVTEGCITYQVEGSTGQHLRAGDAFYEPLNVRVAKFDNEGECPAKFVAFYLLGMDEKETVRILEV